MTELLAEFSSSAYLTDTQLSRCKRIPSLIIAKKYDDDDAYYVVNKADYDVHLNSVEGAPDIVNPDYS
jgi:hypothetical protein